jgi:hypothetical protein
MTVELCLATSVASITRSQAGRRVAATLMSLLALGLLTPAASAGGLSVTPGDATWPRWQAQLSLGVSPLSAWGLRLPAADRPSLPGALLGVYDLGPGELTLPRTEGRWRATSGLLFSLRGSAADAGADSRGRAVWAGEAGRDLLSAPYLGLGYVGWLRGSSLRFSADVGVSAEYPGGSWHFGRALFGNQGFDATLRELQLQPRLQLGVHYAY